MPKNLDAQGEVLATYTQTGASPSTTMLDEFQMYGSQRLGTRPVGTTLAATPNFNYISEDNRASAIVELKLSTFSHNKDVQYKLYDGATYTNLNASTWKWNTGISIARNADSLIKKINANTTVSDIKASVWWSNNATGVLYMQLQFTQPGNWQGQTLKVFVNTSDSSAMANKIPKRALGYGTSKGSVVYGAKRYELANHLGNVLAVISDRKWGIDDGVYNTSTGVKTSSTPDGQTDYYFPTVITFADYDPFGTIQDGRKLDPTLYDYGFQGQEADNEIKNVGQSWNYEYRMHDPRIGRFFAVDPLAGKYPKWTPYAFSGNQVIASRELEGLEPDIDIMEADPNKTYQAKSNASGSVNAILNWTINVSSNGSRNWVPGDEYTGPTASEAADLSNHVYNIDNEGVEPNTKKGTVGDWVLQKEYTSSASTTGYKAGLYRKEIDGVYFYALAFAGTDDFVADIVSDVRQAFGEFELQYPQAYKDAVKVHNFMGTLKKGNSLTFVGHSLGGGMASLAALTTGHPAITFNSAGLSSATKNFYGVTEKTAKIDAYVIVGDAVNHYQRAIGLKAEGTIRYISPVSTRILSYDAYMSLAEASTDDWAVLQKYKANYPAYVLTNQINNHSLSHFLKYF